MNPLKNYMRYALYFSESHISEYVLFVDFLVCINIVLAFH